MKHILSVLLSALLLVNGSVSQGYPGINVHRKVESVIKEENTQQSGHEIIDARQEIKEEQKIVQENQQNSRIEEQKIVQENQPKSREEVPGAEENPEVQLEILEEVCVQEKSEWKKENSEIQEQVTQKKDEWEGKNSVELLEQDKLAAGDVALEQTSEQKKLILEDSETLDKNEKRTGYSIKKSYSITCSHTTGTINGSVKAGKAADPLHPIEAELMSNIVLTGKLKGRAFKKRVEPYDAGGVENTVTHLNLYVDVDAPGIEETLLAGPYVCPDTFAGYAYFEKHYSYCPNTEEFYGIGDSHTWLGCTKGESGEAEYHFRPYSHKFNIYKFIPNNYQVSYHANGGTGTAAAQNAVYDRNLTLDKGDRMKLQGYTLTGWNTKEDGTGRNFKLGERVQNLTAKNGVIVILYAQWRPNALKVTYHKNGGTQNRYESAEISSFVHNWNYETGKKALKGPDFFGLSKFGYTIKSIGEWNTRKDGTGSSFQQGKKYSMIEYAPLLAHGDQEIVLYAQWEPDINRVTLDNRLVKPDIAGDDRIYRKYQSGLFFDSECTQEVGFHKIKIPEKVGYQFKGYYTQTVGGVEMIDKTGALTQQGRAEPNIMGNTVWYAQYAYQVECEDYADVPCDLEEIGVGDSREDLGVQLFYNSSLQKVTVVTRQTGCSVVLSGKPAKTDVGIFQSSVSGNSGSGTSMTTQKVDISLFVLEGAAYQLKVTKDGREIFDRLVYFKDGRFRTLAKLGEKEPKMLELGESIAGSSWGTKELSYGLYDYVSCTQIKNIREPGTVYRFFRYKDVNIAYSGNGATSGANILEYDVPLEKFYRFRKNHFSKEKVETKQTADQKSYDCKVKYLFEGWELDPTISYQEEANIQVSHIYGMAKKSQLISSQTLEDIHTYQVLPSFFVLEKDLFHAQDYINLQAKWNAFPTIVVTPGEKMEFYEGEEVSKEDLIRHLTAHDTEDSQEQSPSDLNQKLRIKKVYYPKPQNGSQDAYEVTFETDVPRDFRLDTYYLKLEKGEELDVIVTFAVTDKDGNTTEEIFPVTIKYNYYPEITSEDVFYYMKEEANQGEISAQALIGRALAKDTEDGDISETLELKDFDPQVFKMQTESQEEFTITYQVTDSYHKTSYKMVKVMVWDEDAVIGEIPNAYVRFISDEYLHTLEENSFWREPDNLAYLKSILLNETPMEIWKFTHEQILEIQNWITELGAGNWKIGQKANQDFLSKFAMCRQKRK